jgi:hypothetical protein
MENLNFKYSPCYLFQQYTTPDYEPECIQTFNNLNKLNEYIINDINYAFENFPNECEKLENFNKEIEFTKWNDFNETNTLYKLKEIFDIEEKWTYIPIMSFTENGKTCHRWIQNYLD